MSNVEEKVYYIAPVDRSGKDLPPHVWQTTDGSFYKFCNDAAFLKPKCAELNRALRHAPRKNPRIFAYVIRECFPEEREAALDVIYESQELDVYKI